MPDVRIKVEHLSKRYEIGTVSNLDLRDTITNGLRRLFRGRPKSKAENTLWALRDVNFELQEGEVLGVIGRNGAGKSTLLKILSKITPPTTGKVVINGRISSLLEVGTGFHPELTGRENIFLNGSVLGMTRAEIRQKFDEIVEFSGVKGFLDTPVKRYSTGMYVRLAFSVAAHLEPEILIVDEVLSVGDFDFQRKCLGKMEDVAGEGRTVIFVSHNMAAVKTLCSRAMLLQSGKVTATGSAKEVIFNYLNVFEQHTFSFDIPVADKDSKPCYVDKLSVYDDEGHPAESVPVGKFWQVKVRLVVRKPIRKLVVAIGMRAFDGTNIRTSWSKPVDVKPGVYYGTFIEDRVVHSAGKYELIVGVSSPGHRIQYSERAGYLNIDEFNEDVQIKIANANVGVVLNQMDFRLEEADESLAAEESRNREGGL